MNITEHSVRTVVVGSGAAGYASAIRLAEHGIETVLVTENVNAGTSRNTGSDKQTYYKLSLASGDEDSVLKMAQDLFSCGAVDGDIALCEAALSTRGFFFLLETGVPFPCTAYGEYMGYKTDHDRGRRATSAGPYTSRLMTQCLEHRAQELGITVFAPLQVIRLLVRNGQIYGILCLDRKDPENPDARIILCESLILATGGPAGIFRDSVYPASQLGGSGMALEAGIHGKNLTEWQFGMASLHPRWNVSGSYMQVLPRFVSTDQDGGDPREFLADFFSDPSDMLSRVFLKGYQWPFDIRKTEGSSLIDLLVCRERVMRNRRVFLDFTRNPLDQAIPLDRLIPEAATYLRSAGAVSGTPIDRLRVLNEPAIRFYRDHGVDLSHDWLEIAVCAQHCNGGLAADANWETDVHGVFAVGEVCGSHGVTRPGGSALNAGQVGAIRASDCIRRRIREEGDWVVPEEICQDLREEAISFLRLAGQAHSDLKAAELFTRFAGRMSEDAGLLRNPPRMQVLRERVNALLAHYTDRVARPEGAELSLFFRLRDMLMTQQS
ncbi:MAG: FAD-binding protein, partial [Clostridia bacterium]|nr:FAD-binding protein [Clostridia bacterium]